MPRAKLYSYPHLRHDIAFSQVPMVSTLITEFLDAQNTGVTSSQTTESPAAQAGGQPLGETVR
jgi:hypothetical protein